MARRKVSVTPPTQAELDLATFTASPEGRRTIWQLLNYCGVFQVSLADTPELTAFNEGKRSVGLRLLSDMTRIDPNYLTTMIKEQGQ